MSLSRVTSFFAVKTPKYLGRLGATASAGAGYIVGEMLDGAKMAEDRRKGQEPQEHTNTDRAINAAVALSIFAPIGYGAGYFTGKGIVKACQFAAKSHPAQEITKLSKKL